jgi:hypothetical protein
MDSGHAEEFHRCVTQAGGIIRVHAFAPILTIVAILVMSAGSADATTTTGHRVASPFADYGLHHWWEADGDAVDAVGADDGTLMFGATFGPGVNGDDQAFAFDGIGGEIRFNADGGNVGPHDFTMAFFVRTTSARKEALWEKRLICDAHSFWGFRIENGLPNWEMMSDRHAHEYNSFSAATPVNDGAWHHVALVRQGPRASMYIDGVLDTSQTIAGVTDLWNHAPMRDGMSACVNVDGTEPFTGLLDEQMIFTAALTQRQIQNVIDRLTETRPIAR